MLGLVPLGLNSPAPSSGFHVEEIYRYSTLFLTVFFQYGCITHRTLDIMLYLSICGDYVRLLSCLSLPGASQTPSDSGPGHSSQHPAGAVLLHRLHLQASPQQALHPPHRHVRYVIPSKPNSKSTAVLCVLYCV